MTVISSASLRRRPTKVQFRYGLQPAIGGKRQRIAIARALACAPELLVLDVLAQPCVLELLMRTRRQHGLTYLFIIQELAVVRSIADRVSVFEKGWLIEVGAADAIFTAPASAYTCRLLGAIPALTAAEAWFRDQFRDRRVRRRDRQQ